MRNFKAYIYSIFAIFLLIGISNASNLENRVTSYFNGLANSLGTSVSSLLSENSRVKYLDLNIGVQEHLKPTISLTNVNMISEYGNSAIFNQNSLNIISKSLMSFVKIKPSKTNNIKNNETLLLKEISTLLEEKNYKTSYTQIITLDSYETYFKETINQIQIANDFKELINTTI